MQVEAQKNEKITVVTMSVDFVDEKIRISNPTKEGYLDKLSSFWKTYRKRWMVVQGYTLYTFKEEKDYENPTEIFDLRIYNKVVPSANGETGQFELSSPNDTRTFLASSENEMKGKKPNSIFESLIICPYTECTEYECTLCLR